MEPAPATELIISVRLITSSPNGDGISNHLKGLEIVAKPSTNGNDSRNVMI